MPIRWWVVTMCGLALLSGPAVAQESAAARYNRGVKLYQEGKLDEAQTEFEAVLAADAKDTETMVWLALIALGRDHASKAAELLTQAATLKPEDDLIQNNLGSAYLALGQLDDAVAAFRKAAALAPKNADAQYNLGVALAKKDDVDGAIAAYQAALANDPRRAAAHHNLANMLKGKGRLDEALQHYREARQLQPETVLYLVNYGLALWDAGQTAEATQEFEAAAQADGGNFAAQLHRGMGYLKSGRIDDAVAALEAAAALNAEDYALQFSLGLAYGRQGNEDAYRKAVAAYQHALQLKPGEADTLTNLGWCYLQLNDLANAEEQFKAAVAAKPDMLLAYNNLAVLYGRKKDQEQAAAAWAKVVELDPDGAEGWWRLGEARLLLQAWAPALEALSKAFELGANPAVVQNEIGYVHDQNGEYEKAEAAYRKAIEADAAYALAYSNLGAALEKQQKIEDATAMYRKALELDPECAEAKFNLDRLAGNG